MIAFAAVFAHSSAAKTRHQQRKIDVDVYHRVDLREFFKRFRLSHVAGKSVQQVAVFAILFLQTVFHDFAGNFVGHQLPFIDIRFGKHADFRLIFNVRAENIARGNVRHSEFIGNARCLRTFARAGRAE